MNSFGDYIYYGSVAKRPCLPKSTDGVCVCVYFVCCRRLFKYVLTTHGIDIIGLSYCRGELCCETQTYGKYLKFDQYSELGFCRIALFCYGRIGLDGIEARVEVKDIW